MIISLKSALTKIQSKPGTVYCTPRDIMWGIYLLTYAMLKSSVSSFLSLSVGKQILLSHVADADGQGRMTLFLLGRAEPGPEISIHD